MVDDGSSCKSSILLVARYPAGKENGVVLCVLKDVPDNILNVGQLGCIVMEHLGSTSWTHSILHLVLFDSLSHAILIVCRNTNVSLHTRWPWK